MFPHKLSSYSGTPIYGWLFIAVLLNHHRFVHEKLPCLPPGEGSLRSEVINMGKTIMEARLQLQHPVINGEKHGYAWVNDDDFDYNK